METINGLVSNAGEAEEALKTGRCSRAAVGPASSITRAIVLFSAHFGTIFYVVTVCADANLRSGS